MSHPPLHAPTGVSVRTATVNALRGLLYEFGVTLPRGGTRASDNWPSRAEINDAVPAVIVQLVDDQLLALADIERHVQAMEEGDQPDAQEPGKRPSSA
ncbi:hypothetical protein [Zoogloea sp.]|uniref:hypothetical protein n=1 Tax=Zoogloea sp. TaxID=49181 RepID=UPI001D57ED60|nr:hypothetical protein [Zoogloea sp.]MBK6655976.1 hypothetical protein [Zoogloea sp.]